MDQPSSEGIAPTESAIQPKADLPRLERLELVTRVASVADGTRPGNGWGGHQTRVVRLHNGDVYTAYLTPGPTFDTSQWHLARRGEGGWRRVASGAAGREPVNILRTSDEGIALVAWPGNLPLLTTFDLTDGRNDRREMPIPGRWEVSAWPYNAAGIGSDGTLCALQSNSPLQPGMISWACRVAPDRNWEFRQSSLPQRHCYAFLFPNGTQLTLVALRGVPWSTLGYAKPAHAFDYVFNDLRAYANYDFGGTGLASTLIREEAPTREFPEPVVHQVEAYMDVQDRLHVIYTVVGHSTRGVKQSRHAVLRDGKIMADVDLPEEGFWRITQDSTGRFWALYGRGSRFAVYPAVSQDGLELGAPIELDIGAEQVLYAGMAITAPRAGVPVDDIVDGVFPSGRAGERWVYFRLRLR